jgi:methylenetetrahydrofolate--tRNA-(uracil-5-)-methyltransferase
MNVNFGLFPPIPEFQHRMPHAERGKAKRRAITTRALRDLDAWLAADVADAAE